eukprot:6668587-Pyramimonas_sp.AAC.1
MDDIAAPFETVDGQNMNNVFNREGSIAFNSNKPWGFWQLRILLKPTVARETQCGRSEIFGRASWMKNMHHWQQQTLSGIRSMHVSR